MPQAPSFPDRPANLDYDRTLILAIELSNKKWVLAAQVPGMPQTKARRTIEPTPEALMAAIRDDIPAEEQRRLARQESDGRVACRLLGLANVVDGMSRERAARQAGMDRQTLRDWVIRWLDDGQLAPLKALVLRGADPERDGVSSWRAKDLCRIVEDRCSVSYTENGMLRLLHDLGLSRQKARPIHPEADRQAQARFKKIPGADRRDRARAPRGRAARGLVPRRGPGSARPAASAGAGSSAACVRAACATCATRRSTCSGRSVRHATRASLWCCPRSAPPRCRRCSTSSARPSAGAHAVVLMDRAGWHIAKQLAVPANLTPLFLPPYSPELNAIERLWPYLRERFLSHRLWPSYDDILDACCAAWNALLNETGRIRSLCTLTGPHRSVLNGAGIRRGSCSARGHVTSVPR